ncbi:MAG: YMGG-like glycine zipper-containing protein [Pseudomonadota bacterium]
MTSSRYMAAMIVVLTLAGCSGMDTRTQRTLSGGAIGSAGGAAIGALAGGSLFTGALIGGAAGAAVGYLTSEDEVQVGN